MPRYGLSRRRFLKLGGASAFVVVIAGVGAYLALQPQPAPPIPSPVKPTTPKPAPVTAPPKPTPNLVDKANEEGAVMTYTSWDVASMEAINKGFEKKYPKVKTDIVRANDAVLIERMRNEHAAGKYILDLWVGSVSSLLGGPLDEGWVDRYISPEAALFPPHLKDPEGLWIVPQLAPQAIQYNTELVKGEDIPKSYWDLLKPRFKNKIAVYGARASPHAPLVSKRKIIGPDRWMEFLRGLKAQNAKETAVVGQNNAMMKQGEIEVSLWSYPGSATEENQKGSPIDYVRKPGTLLAGGSVLWLYKKAPHPNAARLLYDYLLSEEGQTLINDMGKYVELRPGIPPKMGLGIGVGEPVKPEYVAYAWPWTAKDAANIVTEWSNIFPIT